MIQKRTYYKNPIPHIEFPKGRVSCTPSSESLITLEQIAPHAKGRIIYEPVYFKLGLAGSVSQCRLREGAAARLLKALDMLPSEYGFKIFDAWRTFELQTTLYNKYKDMIIKNCADCTDAESDIIANQYVSVPANDPENPPVHTTGGSVDLTIIRINDNQELNMGTVFDFFGERASSDYFELQSRCLSLLDEEIRKNRRMLYNIMICAGFSNLPSEWWHYDYGNAYWAFSTGCNAIYKGIFK